jgi:hypothetical protein
MVQRGKLSHVRSTTGGPHYCLVWEIQDVPFKMQPTCNHLYSGRNIKSEAGPSQSTRLSQPPLWHSSQGHLLLGRCSLQLRKSCAGDNMVYSRADHVFILESLLKYPTKLGGTRTPFLADCCQHWPRKTSQSRTNHSEKCGWFLPGRWRPPTAVSLFYRFS